MRQCSTTTVLMNEILIKKISIKRTIVETKLRMKRRRKTEEIETFRMSPGRRELKQLFIIKQPSINYRKLFQSSVLILLITLVTHLTSKTINGQQQQQLNLPTVIVRGFLNYRTTVDGTVLLFTPDVGGSASGQSTQQVAIQSSSIMNNNNNNNLVSPTTMNAQQQIEPTSVALAFGNNRQQSTVATFSTNTNMEQTGQMLSSNEQTPGNSNPFGGPGAPVVVSADSDWRHITTPPLRSTMQTTFKPNNFQAKEQATTTAAAASASIEPTNAGRLVETLAVLAPASSATQLDSNSMMINDAASSEKETTTPAPRLIAISNNEAQSSASSSSQTGGNIPSVQTDDIAHTTNNNSFNKKQTTANGNELPASTTSPHSTTGHHGHARASPRPKRPSLGFTGQGIRGGISLSSRAHAAGNGPTNSTSEQHHPPNTINGIRRPGLSITTTTSTPSPNGASSQPASGAPAATAERGALSPLLQQAGGNGNAAFQNRLTNASLKLRNKFKRPSFHSSSSNAAAAVANNQTSLQMNNSGQSGSPLVDMNESISSLVETLGDNSALSNHNDNNNNNNNNNQLLSPLQARMGDIFNPGASIGTSPIVASDEILIAASSRDSASPPSNEASKDELGKDLININNENNQAEGEQPASTKVLLSRSGEQAPPGRENKHQQEESSGQPALLSGGLSGALETNLPLNLDGFFSDQSANNNNNNNNNNSGGQVQEIASSEQASEHHVKHKHPPGGNHPTGSGSAGGKEAFASALKKSNNDKLNSWLDHHGNNKFIPRPATTNNNNQQQHEQGNLSQQLASNPNLQIAPSFSANIPQASIQQQREQQIKSTPVLSGSLELAGGTTLKPAVGADDVLGTVQSEKTLSQSSSDMASNETEILQLQTITKTYSTIMTTSKTRLVPLQVKSSTAIHTITENYVITKMLTTYQTMPIGEFILPENSLSTKSPFDMFEESFDKSNNNAKLERENNNNIPASAQQQQVAVSSPVQEQEQPISLDTSSQGAPPAKSPNDWLHDFTNNNQQNQPQQQQQHNNNNNENQLAALLEQQAQEANLAGAGFPLIMGEPLDGLASQLDPTALFANGAINIPDLNNPLVLAAAIQNPQLAAVILAAQQLQLKQRQQKHQANNNNNNNQLIQPQQQQLLQPSYSTSFSTVIKPSTYTIKDTMYTTRLVSFKDGRTVRTRTVSEPGSVVEQVLTTMATEVTPITITIRPTGVLGSGQQILATASPGNPAALASSQATINNALIATQLASLLARRQQQIIQPSTSGLLANQNGASFLNNNNNGNSNQANQLAALQQLIGQQRQQQQQAKQFQPNLQQLLQSMQHSNINQQQQQPVSSANNFDERQQQNQRAAGSDNKQSSQPKQLDLQQQQQQQQAVAPTPPLPSLGPITTTLTNLQIRTYTVHNAFKTIYRTITSTQLITSTIFPGGLGANKSTQMPQLLG